MADKKPFQHLRPFTRGTRLTAAQLDQQRQAIERISGGVNAPSQISAAGQARATVSQQFRIGAIKGDYLECQPYANGNYDEDQKIRVAKPYLLRKTVTSRNGITYTFDSDSAGTAGTQRTATEGAATEIQVVIPSYLEGDIIYAIRNIIGGTSVILATQGRETYIEWLDLNADGRAWAKKA